MLKTILMVIYVIVCIVLAIVVLSQEGKDASLTSSISGAGGGFDNSYWSKNKGSSKQEILKKITQFSQFSSLYLHYCLTQSFSTNNDF